MPPAGADRRHGHSMGGCPTGRDPSLPRLPPAPGPQWLGAHRTSTPKAVDWQGSGRSGHLRVGRSPRSAAGTTDEFPAWRSSHWHDRLRVFSRRDQDRVLPRGRPVRRLVVSAFVTLDGVMQAPGAPEEDPTGEFAHGGWSVNYWDDVMGIPVVVARASGCSGRARSPAGWSSSTSRRRAPASSWRRTGGPGPANRARSPSGTRPTRRSSAATASPARRPPRSGRGR